LIRGKLKVFKPVAAGIMIKILAGIYRGVDGIQIDDRNLRRSYKSKNKIDKDVQNDKRDFITSGPVIPE
jgi:hypothetical protein